MGYVWLEMCRLVLFNLIGTYGQKLNITHENNGRNKRGIPLESLLLCRLTLYQTTNFCTGPN